MVHASFQYLLPTLGHTIYAHHKFQQTGFHFLKYILWPSYFLAYFLLWNICSVAAASELLTFRPIPLGSNIMCMGKGDYFL